MEEDEVITDEEGTPVDPEDESDSPPVDEEEVPPVEDDGDRPDVDWSETGVEGDAHPQQTFTSQPTTPYYEGDMWQDGTTTYLCLNTRLTGSYDSTDWTPAVNPEPTPQVITRTRTYDEVITDYSAASLAAYEAAGAVAYAIYDDGTEQQFAWADVYDPSSPAVEAVSEAWAVASATNQFFWHRSTDPDGDGAGTGAFVTDDTQENFLAAAAQDFPDRSATKPYMNQLINSQGTLLRSGKINLAQFTPSGTAYYDGLGNEASNIDAYFARTGMRIGKDYLWNTVVDDSGVSFNWGGASQAKFITKSAGYYQSSQGAELDPGMGMSPVEELYGNSGLATPSTEHPAIISYYVRNEDGVVSGEERFTSDYPFAFTKAGVEFGVTKSSGWRLGYDILNTTDSVVMASITVYLPLGNASAALLIGTTSSPYPGRASLSVGQDTVSYADYSLAVGQGIRLGSGGGPWYYGRLAIGTYNINNHIDNAFMIGNGTSDTARSNSFAVKQSGSVVNYGSATDSMAAYETHHSDIDSADTTRTANVWKRLLVGRDQNDVANTLLETRYDTSGAVTTNLYSSLEVNGAPVYRGLQLIAQPNGDGDAYLQGSRLVIGQGGGTLSSLQFSTGNYSGSFIRAYDNGTTYGHNVLIQSGGLLILGGGEYPANRYALSDLQGQDLEQTYIGSDNEVVIEAGGNTIASRKTFTFGNGGDIWMPKDGRVWVDSSVIDISATSQTSRVTTSGITLRDKNENVVGNVSAEQLANGATGFLLSARRGSTYNAVSLRVANDGTREVYVDAPEAWRKATQTPQVQISDSNATTFTATPPARQVSGAGTWRLVLLITNYGMDIVRYNDTNTTVNVVHIAGTAPTVTKTAGATGVLTATYSAVRYGGVRWLFLD